MRALDDFLTEFTVTASQIKAAKKKLQKAKHATDPAVYLISKLASYIGACEAYLNAAEFLRASLTKEQLLAEPNTNQIASLASMAVSKHLLLNAL